jgi:hypothetical protein
MNEFAIQPGGLTKRLGEFTAVGIRLPMEPFY